jgi:hypothetical protein
LGWQATGGITANIGIPTAQNWAERLFALLRIYIRGVQPLILWILYIAAKTALESIETQPTIFVIYGGTGDLSCRKLAPALYNLYLDGWMPARFSIIGTGRSSLSNEDFREKLLNGINQFSDRARPTRKSGIHSAKNIFTSLPTIRIRNPTLP